MNTYDEETIAELLRLLPPPPSGWVEAAQELPLARAQLDEIVARAERDADFRRQLLADLERALTEAGYEPRGRLVAELRERLSDR